MSTPKSYLDNFHLHHLNESLTSAKALVPVLLNYFEFSTVLDVGCGIGTWLKVFKENGKVIYGIDGHYVNRAELLIDNDEFGSYDLSYPFDLKKRFDLLVCLEVAEHLHSERAFDFINSICKHSDLIVFSAAIPGQEGTLHYNEQLNDYWVNIFEKNQYSCFDSIRHQVWNDTRISWWYRQNVLVFIKNSILDDPKYKEIKHKSVNYKNTYVHPDLFFSKSNKAKYLAERADYLESIIHNPVKLLWYYVRCLTNRIK